MAVSLRDCGERWRPETESRIPSESGPPEKANQLGTSAAALEGPSGEAQSLAGNTKKQERHLGQREAISWQRVGVKRCQTKKF